MSPLGKRSFFAIGLCIVTVVVRAEPRRRALLVGIDDYSPQRQASKGAQVTGRDFGNLGGAVNDVEVMRGLLTSVCHFKPDEIAILKNQEATRDAILAAIGSNLIRGAQKGDVLLFYFSGHGSQVTNSLSEEDDHLDESIVPADVPRGAHDIRDKELRRLFRPPLALGAHLTIILDSCYSGSGVRGLPGGEGGRQGPPDRNDVKDGYRGPKLEDAGALILSAARDTDIAFEAPGFNGKLQGVFSWAWTRAVRDAVPNEPAIETFQRAAGRMRFERPDQVPVIAGNAEARFTPFLGVRKDRETDRVVVSVRSIDPKNGLVTIQGGWANGLTLNSELRPVTNPPSAVRLQIVAMDGMTGCTAKITAGSPKSLDSGALLKLVGWAAPRDQPLRVWVPQGNAHITAFAHALAAKANDAGLNWLEDPILQFPASVVRWNGETWEWLDASRKRATLGPEPDAGAVIGKLSGAASLFVQLPASPEFGRRITSQGGVERVTRPQDADYILTGRLSHGRLEYAWVHHSVDMRDQAGCPLPLRTDWHHGLKTSEVAADLNEDLRRLERIHLWQTLPSPQETQFNYRLGIRRARDNELITDKTLIAEEPYGLVLRAVAGPSELSSPRFVYVFVVDSYGKSVLLFPRGPIGSVENHFPTPSSAPPEIRLGEAASFIPEAPFGTDTYFLLSTDEALTDPWILEWDGVRTRKGRGGTPLERLLLLILSHNRAPRVIPPPSRWSVERSPYETKQSHAAHNSHTEVSQ